MNSSQLLIVYLRSPRAQPCPPKQGGAAIAKVKMAINRGLGIILPSPALCVTVILRLFFF